MDSSSLRSTSQGRKVDCLPRPEIPTGSVWNSYKDKRRNRPTSAVAREVTRSWPSHPSAAPAPAASASASVAPALTAAPHNEQCPHISTRTADLDGSWRQSSPRAYCGCSHTYQGLCIEIAAFDYFKHPLHIHGPGDSFTRSGIGRYGETSQAQQGADPVDTVAASIPRFPQRHGASHGPCKAPNATPHPNHHEYPANGG